VKFRLFGCGKFEWLALEAEDRPLSPAERRFVERHRGVCASCELTARQTSMALNMLREAALEPEVTPSFEDRVLRRHKLGQARASIRYWSPAVLGAAVAMVAVLAALQLVAQTAQLPDFRAPGADARRSDENTRVFPRLNLDRNQ
jgi:hypothetical protein